jgi:hypothetical protein
MEARATAELRGVGNYVAWLIAQDLARKPKRRRTRAKPSDRREGYTMVVPISAKDRRELEARAEAEMRSLSNYVATLILEDLRGA